MTDINGMLLMLHPIGERQSKQGNKLQVMERQILKSYDKSSTDVTVCLEGSFDKIQDKMCFGVCKLDDK